MKTIFLILVALVLSGCNTALVKPPIDQVVTIDKAIPVCPKPPTVPQFPREVDSLTSADAAQPGKVAKAYVIDMTILRAQVSIYQSILDEYMKTEQDFAAAKAQIDKLQTK